MPRHDIERRVCLLCGEQFPGELAQERPLSLGVFFEVGDGCLEVPRVRETVTPYWSKLGQLKVPLIQLEDIAAHWPQRKRNAIPNASGNDADFVRTNQQTTELGLNVKNAVLQHDEEVAVGAVERFVRVHALPCRENEIAQS